MSFDTILGILLTFFSLAFLILLLFRSNHIIKVIYRNNLNSAREIKNKLHEK